MADEKQVTTIDFFKTSDYEVTLQMEPMIFQLQGIGNLRGIAETSFEELFQEDWSKYRAMRFTIQFSSNEPSIDVDIELTPERRELLAKAHKYLQDKQLYFDL